MLSRRGLPSPPPFTAADDPDDSGSCLGMAGAGGGAGVATGEALAAAAATGLGFSAGSALVPGLAMLPLQLDFIPSVPSTHLSTMALAFFVEIKPNLRAGGEGTDGTTRRETKGRENK